MYGMLIMISEYRLPMIIIETACLNIRLSIIVSELVLNKDSGDGL